MRVLFVATVQSHIAQFHLKAIELFRQKGYEVHVAARDNLAEKNGLQLKNVDQVFDIPFQRSPFSPKNLSAYRQLKEVIQKGDYEIIHCNTPVGGILTRLAARKAKGEVIYTAHGFHFYKGAPLKNWLIYYPMEKIMARFTDKLITINEEDYCLAKTKFRCSVYRIHGTGINTEKYRNVSDQEMKELLQKQELQNRTIILCTGELNKNKNQKTVITAMKSVVQVIPDAVLLLAGNGPEQAALEQLIFELGLQEYVRLLGYRTDLQKYVKAADMIVSASLREGLGLNILEAMFCRKPVIAADNRGHRELIEENENGYLVKPLDAGGFADKMIYLCQNSEKCTFMGNLGYEKSVPYWDVNVVKELASIYW